VSSRDDDLDPALAPTEALGARTREAAPKGGRGSSLVGQVIVHYRVLRELDRGGMGVVYEALDERVARRVAIKVVGEAGDADTALRRFRQEARAIASLNHPNVCTLYEVEEQDGRPVIVMELLEGETLKTRLAREPIDTPQLLQWSLELADALDAAHARGLIHRDIKPGNVFITTRGTVKVLDFGLAKSFAEPEDGAHHDASQTREGTVHGTVPYMSPEQVRGETLDARADLFSSAPSSMRCRGRDSFNAVNAGLSVDAVSTSNRQRCPASRGICPLASLPSSTERSVRTGQSDIRTPRRCAVI
jgi:serine/threonine protein kinase